METERMFINREYVNKLESFFMWPLQISGLSRFETKDSKLTEKSFRSVLRGTVILLIWNLCGIYVLYDTTVLRSNYLLLSEFLVLLQFLFAQNCTSINVMFLNRKSGLTIIKTCMNIDVLFGVHETKFMRSIPDKLYVILSTFVAIIITTIALGVVFSHAIFFSIVVTETIFIILLYPMFNGFIVLLPILTFLSMRIRYLNISLIKMATLKRNYFPKHLIFDTLFWKDKHDNLVNFHKQATIKKYKEAFTLIYKLFRHIEISFRFFILIGLIICVSGLIIMVQWIVAYLKSTDVSNTRTGAVTGWVITGWCFFYVLGVQVDIVKRQIEDTKLICTNIFLQPHIPGEFIELAGSLLHTLDGQEYKISVFGMFYFNTDLMVKIFEAIIVYIIMQLQLSFVSAPINLLTSDVKERFHSIFVM